MQVSLTPIKNIRLQPGELGVMAAQTEAMERKILARAQELLSDVEGKLDKARVEAMTGDDDAKIHYAGMIEVRSRLQQVIVHAKMVLGP